MAVDINALRSGAPLSDVIKYDQSEIDNAVKTYSTQFGVDEHLVHSMIHQESRGKGGAISLKGAQGLMQLMPETAKSLGVTDPFSVDQNIRAGIQYVKQQMDANKGDIKLALAGYNAGPGAVAKYKGIPPFEETQNYVKDIMRKFVLRKVNAALGAPAQTTPNVPPVAPNVAPPPVEPEVIPAPNTLLPPEPVDSPPQPGAPLGAVPEPFSRDTLPQPPTAEQLTSPAPTQPERFTAEQMLKQKPKAAAIGLIDKAVTKLYTLDNFLRSSKVKRKESPLPEGADPNDIPGITSPLPETPPRPPEMEGKEWPTPEYIPDWSSPPSSAKRLARWFRDVKPEWRE